MVLDMGSRRSSIWVQSGCLAGIIVGLLGLLHHQLVLEIVGFGAAIVFEYFALRLAWKWWRRANAAPPPSGRDVDRMST
jgi:hypothetical protein